MCLKTKPSIVYLNETSFLIKKIVNSVNEYFSKKLNEGYNFYSVYTFDAGPNAVVFVRKSISDHFLKIMCSLFKFEKKTNFEIKKNGEIENDFLNFLKLKNSFEIKEKVYLDQIIKTTIGDGPKVQFFGDFNIK